jgi:acetylornithine deacetylase
MTEDVVELTAELIRIDSVNPTLAAGAAGEMQIAYFAAGWLRERGFDCTLLEERPGRPSVLAFAHGTGGGRSVMLNGHLDTVSLQSYDGDGLEPVVIGDRLEGRGAYDMKSGLAAIMAAASDAASNPHRGDIVVALVADEEDGSLGTEEVLRSIVTDAAIVVEPSGLDIVTAHRGFVWIDVAIHGRAAHGSRPDLGVDAIVKAGSFLSGLESLGQRLAEGSRHPLLGTGSVHASIISGGIEASTFPDKCTITLERRTVPGETAATVDAELRYVLDNLASVDPDFRYDLTITAARAPFLAVQGSRTVAALDASYQREVGSAATLRGEPFWTDCALLADAGIDTALFGVDGGGAHAATEWVSISSLRTTTRVLKGAILTLTNQEQAGQRTPRAHCPNSREIVCRLAPGN